MDSFRFFEGTWLEAYTKKLLVDSNFFDDIKTSLVIDGSTNESDVAVMSQAKFALIQCKTSSEYVKEGDLGKLSSIQAKVGGPYSTAIMIICEKIPEKTEELGTTQKNIIDHAKQHTVELIWKQNFDRMADIVAEKMGIKRDSA